MKARRVVFIGAAGEMSRIAIERFARAGGDWHLTLCDIRPEILEPLVARLPAGRATVRRLDLFNHQDLLDTISGAALVVLGAGPYLRTSEPVITACIEAKVPYLDFDDDVESTQHALSVHEKAEAAGIPLYIGCGASPGATNVMVVDAANQLDSVETIQVGWLMGDERPVVGRAVIHHMLHISVGNCLTWENGGPVNHDSFVETTTMTLGGGIKETVLYETAHPEPVTLPRRYPGARSIRCFGGLDPAPTNGLARGIALAVHEGRLTEDEAVDYIVDVANERFLGNRRALRAMLGGLFGQVRRGETSWGTLLKFAAKSAAHRGYSWRGGLVARVSGTRDGRPAVAVRRTPVTGPDTYYAATMGTLTGTACAAFMVLALDTAGERAGAFAPEDWADPQAFYTALERVGTPRSEIVEAVHY
ncbi:saccharopine dehydrogenase NADP-binding domain-containing protein [Streptomyces sp. ISL-22]|uniref:saccharopine dehydrogenase family protein n=1 Tax=unclassified Streptomyces TaxID=2593676 RepID=UPI001BE66481|nr:MULTISPECIES: saccharopine dehydrogenase NADP-binding domain-containing protein [unclassified Streptomyces]MBT2423778.1 saccharopine dehydrogenase NADP-binding domain-containing protein [Streptomyces sp. ISL-24]MBT2433498.1 saccharopine dehydrogenase NADP-binding domain-containing protein [Streptomyces sp. ISL-22]